MWGGAGGGVSAPDQEHVWWGEVNGSTITGGLTYCTVSLRGERGGLTCITEQG